MGLRFSPAVAIRLALITAVASTFSVAQAAETTTDSTQVAKEQDVLAKMATDSADSQTQGLATSQARGVLQAVEQATISSEIAGRINALPFREGQSFKKGEALVKFDCSTYEAQLSASQAASRAAQAELSQNRQLAEMRSVGKYAVSLSAAHLAEAQAQSKVYKLQVDRCTLTAPFSGQVVQTEVNPYESVAAGTPLMDIVNNQTLEIHILVPSRWLPQLKAGQNFQFTPDETGKPLQASISRLGARIDEGSQTISLIGKLTAPASDLLSGMSGTAHFEGLK
ncbi:efflux RND transporter periplasmic adaptor subunit [Pokkaliibacter sp. CJK22405]|uniref:efflux RND transporter periplasmic adaptor subunit n=1 Tax=Pokkaliibacter sp. CJK22405 TaxID=3384615 RepID=UPI003984D9F5